MKTIRCLPASRFVALAFLILNAAMFAAFAQNSVITYQGRVTDNGTNFTGTGQFKFALITSNSVNHFVFTYWSNDGTSGNGSEPNTFVEVAVTDGLFTVKLGDTNLPNMTPLPAAMFAQPDLRLQIWFNDGANGFAALNPAQALTAAPYALNAQGLSAGLTITQNTNGAPNVIIGSSENSVANGVVGATVGGGGATDFYGSLAPNRVNASYGTVAGGVWNTVNGESATVSGGRSSTAGGDYATVGGGSYNQAYGSSATVAGGGSNTAGSSNATVGGGYDNTANGYAATVGGGYNNYSSGGSSAIGGGQNNQVTGMYAAILGGLKNIASGNTATVSGGYLGLASGSYAAVGGGQWNKATN